MKGVDKTSAIGSPDRMRQTGATIGGSRYKSPPDQSTYHGMTVFESGKDFGDIDIDYEHREQQLRYQSQIENKVANLFKEQLDLERNLERAKVDLSLRTDYNLIDAFRVFDPEGKGWISGNEIKKGLVNFSVFVQDEDVSLFMMRYDKDEDGRVRYSEFCDAFLPTDQFHASLLAKKAPLHMHHMETQVDRIFYPETMFFITHCWNTHINNERKAE